MQRPLVLLLAATTLPLAAYATKPVANSYVAQPPCEDGMRKNVVFSTSFNGQEKTLNEARNAVETNKNALQSAAKKVGVTIDPTNYSYNISMNSNYNNGAVMQNYNYSGNLNYQIQNEDQGKKLGDVLDEQKRPFSMSVSANKCSN